MRKFFFQIRRRDYSYDLRKWARDRHPNILNRKKINKELSNVKREAKKNEFIKFYLELKDCLELLKK